MTSTFSLFAEPLGKHCQNKREYTVKLMLSINFTGLSKTNAWVTLLVSAAFNFLCLFFILCQIRWRKYTYLCKIWQKCFKIVLSKFVLVQLTGMILMTQNLHLKQNLDEPTEALAIQNEKVLVWGQKDLAHRMVM